MSDLPNQGEIPLALAQQQAKLAALRSGTPMPKFNNPAPPPAPPEASDPVQRTGFEGAAEAQEIVNEVMRTAPPLPSTGRTYRADLSYRPPPPAVGFILSFNIRTWSETELYVNLEHGPTMELALTDLVERMQLKIGGKTWDVSWTGQSFSLPELKVYGISFLKCTTPNHKE